MTHIDDLGPYDDRSQEEPPDLDEPPIDLDEVAADLADAQSDPQSGGEATEAVLEAVPHLLEELRAARKQLAYWRELPLRQEYAITDGTHPDQASVIWPGSAEDAARLAEDPTHKGWVRSVTVHLWQDLAELDAEPPF